MRVKRRNGLKASVDLVPMIDVVFQLILFFLVSTTFAVLPGISVALPESSTAKSVASAGITITAEKNGDMYFNELKVSYRALDENLAAFDTGEKLREEYPVTLEADSEVTNGTIVRIFDVLRKNGFSAVNLRTTKK
ncbi:biopolymer transporter ExbD [Treponema parvum]|uniref:Biopolymer transporter ExbD n=1 Tax=Treponema parvum TaxID=138851 RepID=A0A975F2Y8_9SPIR|nr:biopolymer transporter ExbD [Treponema parvum]QTQ13428.1 biopolymer transporter ExbD [Treponema parvum]